MSETKHLCIPVDEKHRRNRPKYVVTLLLLQPYCWSICAVSVDAWFLAQYCIFYGGTTSVQCCHVSLILSVKTLHGWDSTCFYRPCENVAAHCTQTQGTPFEFNHPCFAPVSAQRVLTVPSYFPISPSADYLG